MFFAPTLADVSISATDTRLALIGLAGLLVATLGFIAACAVILRRRSARAAAAARPPARRRADTRPMVAAAPAAATASAHAAGGGGLVEVASDPMACPSCRREYDAWLEYCPHDARRLIPAPEMLERVRTGGGICPSCRRAFEAEVRFCPHDGAELEAMSVYEATRGQPASEAEGVIGRICPQCNRRYDIAVAFCGSDGSELVSLN